MQHVKTESDPQLNAVIQMPRRSEWLMGAGEGGGQTERGEAPGVKRREGA